jgi:hypothetical protein
MIQSNSSPYNALKLAKKGDPKAIQAVINHLLKDQNITTEVSLKNDSIYIILESEETIYQPLATASLVKILNKINAPYITTAVIQAKTKGKVNPIWTECIQLNSQLNSQLQAENFDNQQKKTAISFYWPAWFPYPSSWLRTIILLLWTGFIVRIFGFWGVFFGDLISNLADNPILFLQIVGVSLLASSLVLSYIYHIIDFKNSSHYYWWFPRPIKLWEGIYAPIVLILSVIVVILIGHPFVPWNECTLLGFPPSNYCSHTVDDYIRELTNFETRIWLLSIAYLYQIEYLLRIHFPFKKFLKLAGITFITIFTIISLQFTLKYWDYIYGTLTALFQPSPTTESIHRTPVNTETPIKAPEVDPFKEAINQATIAAELTQSAQSKLEWEKVANHWKNALEFMKKVPSDHSNSAIAQDRVIQYQKNLDYANLAASQVIDEL